MSRAKSLFHWSVKHYQMTLSDILGVVWKRLLWPGNTRYVLVEKKTKIFSITQSYLEVGYGRPLLNNMLSKAFKRVSAAINAPI